MFFCVCLYLLHLHLCNKCCVCVQSRSRVPAHLKKGALVQVLYENDDGTTKQWWNALVLKKYRKEPFGFEIRYEDEEGCTEEHVQPERIRPRECSA